MDQALIFAIVAALMLMLALSLVGYRMMYKPGKVLRQLGTPVISGGTNPGLEAGAEQPPSVIVSVLQRLGSRLPSSEKESATLRTELMCAGYRSENAATIFNGTRVAAAIGGGLLALALAAHMPSNPSMQVILPAMGVLAGLVLPKTLLRKRIARRQEVIRLSLPDALDLLVVSVEAGLGLDQAIQHVARELKVAHPALSEELSLVTLEMRAGKRRADALRNLAERIGEPDVRKLVAILIQNDRFGTSMGESLRTHSDFMRERRRQEAEERAGKVGVKLVFPIFFFVLPSILIVAAGPGILQIFKYLFPMMNGTAGLP